jgi:hypothetical protein
VLSVKKTFPFASTVIADAPFRDADVAGPPSPASPETPFPAMVRIQPYELAPQGV